VNSAILTHWITMLLWCSNDWW